MTRPRNEQEALNYQKVLRYISFVAGQPEFKLTEHLIKRINSITLEGIQEYDHVRGRYKAVQNWVPGRLVPPPPAETPRLMAEFVAEANELLAQANPEDPELHPVVIAAMVMWRLLNIHPFTQGNGRTARAVATLILMRYGYLGIQTGDRLYPVRSLEWYFDQHRTHYADCLTLADQGHFEPWVAHFSNAVRATMTLIKDKVEESAARPERL